MTVAWRRWPAPAPHLGQRLVHREIQRPQVEDAELPVLPRIAEVHPVGPRPLQVRLRVLLEYRDDRRPRPRAGPPR